MTPWKLTDQDPGECNVADRATGRTNGLIGKRRPRRLTDEQVAELRAAERGEITALAASFGIARSYAYQVRSGRRCNV